MRWDAQEREKYPLREQVSMSVRSWGELAHPLLGIGGILGLTRSGHCHDTRYVCRAKQGLHRRGQVRDLVLDGCLGDPVHQFHLVRSGYLIEYRDFFWRGPRQPFNYGWFIQDTRHPELGRLVSDGPNDRTSESMPEDGTDYLSSKRRAQNANIPSVE